MLRLYIGDKNYSTWSMRPWLVLRHFQISFREQLIAFDDFQLDSPFKQKILRINPTGKVPALVDDDGMEEVPWFGTHWRSVNIWWKNFPKNIYILWIFNNVSVRVVLQQKCTAVL